MSDSDEPDWLVEQSSAHKAQAAASRFSDDSLSDERSDDGAQDEVDASQDAEAKPNKSKGKGRAPPSSVLPLLLAPKVRRDVLLLEVDDSNLDFSGDFGVIGKMHVRKGAGTAGSSQGGASSSADDGTIADVRRTLMLDLKGKVYDGDVVPCNSLCLLQVDGSKAKIEAIFSDYVQLQAPRDSIFDAQEVSHGELGDGFFDDDVLSNVDGGSDDEEELGPLREGGKKGKGGAKKGKPAAKKGKGAGAKRKSTGSSKPPAKKAKK